MSSHRFRLGAVLVLLLSFLPVASGAGFTEASFAQVGAGVWQPARFWCDTPGRVLALSGAGAGAGTLTQWVRGVRSQVAVTIGADDAGAGQVYTPLTFAGSSAPAPGFFVHSSNVENVRTCRTPRTA